MEDCDMNTDVQRNHKIVVGAGVVLVALAAIGALAVNVHRAVPSRITPTVAPTPAALPETLVPAANQSSESPPPPVAEGAPLTNAGTGAAASATAPLSAPTQEAVTAAPKSSAKVPSLAATHPRVEPAARSPTAANTLKDKGEEVAMAGPAAASTAPDASRPESAAAASSGMLAASNGGTTDIAPGTVESQSSGSAGADASSVGGAPAVSGAEVTTTMQARAAGGDSANSDHMITSAVKSEIASDAAASGTALEVTTINGVVILTGTVPTPDAVEHVKQVVQQVKDVKGVDATGVKVSSS